jgi:hypothetical protein
MDLNYITLIPILGGVFFYIKTLFGNIYKYSIRKDNIKNNKTTDDKNNDINIKKPLSCPHKYVIDYTVENFNYNTFENDIKNNLYSNYNSDSNNDSNSDSNTESNSDTDTYSGSDSNSESYQSYESDEIEYTYNDEPDLEPDNLDEISYSDYLKYIYNSFYKDDNEIEKNENYVINNENKFDVNIFITTNYEDELKKTNNPFYKNLKIEYEVIFEKFHNLLFLTNSPSDLKNSFFNDNDTVHVKYTNVNNSNSDGSNRNNNGNIDINNNLQGNIQDSDILINYKDGVIIIPDNWNIITENDDYIKFVVKENNINNFIDKLIILTNIYYEINECNYDCNLINLIFNGNTYDVFNNNTESFEEDDMVFKFINIKNLYGYLNRDDNMLDYSVVNFNKTEDLRTYYNNNKNNLEEMYNNFDFN